MSGLGVGSSAPASTAGGMEATPRRESASAAGLCGDAPGQGLLPPASSPGVGAGGPMPDAQQVARFAALLTAPAGAALADGSTDASGATDTPSSAESTALHRPPDPSRQAGRWDERQQDQPHDRDRDPPPAEPLPSPMALFSRAVEPAPAALSAPVVTPAPDLALLMHIERLAVGDDRIGQRRVRLTLADTLLPDTEVEVGHEAGALQVSFFCHRSAGCQALQAQAPSLADQLATRLQQDVWLSVGDARRDDPGRLHVQARADRLRDTTP